jgi:hypothetical protein
LIAHNGNGTEKTLPRALKLAQTTPRLRATSVADPQGVPGLPNVHDVVMSAFDPLLGEGMTALKPLSGDLIEPLHTWEVGLPADFDGNMG